MTDAEKIAHLIEIVKRAQKLVASDIWTWHEDAKDILKECGEWRLPRLMLIRNLRGKPIVKRIHASLDMQLELNRSRSWYDGWKRRN